MGTRQAALGASMLLLLHTVPGAEAGPGAPRSGLQQEGNTGLRTDRLSGKKLRKWRQIVAIVRAEDRHGRALHPTLRGLFDAVDTSSHSIFIEMPDTKSYLAGRFELTTVDPEGEAHEGILILNLRAIDKAGTGPAAARAGGFIPFDGLGKTERYAEVLGHELAHAVWHLASPERARLAARLQGEFEEQARTLLADRVAGRGVDRSRSETDLDRLERQLEEPAQTAEAAIWEELRAGQRNR